MKHEAINKYSFMFYISCFMTVDQVTKAIFANRDFLIKNYGLPFGLNFHPVLNSTIIVISLIIFIVYYFYLNPSTFKSQLGFILIFSGALSNLLDRLILGYVRDFIDSQLLFSFNFADLFITIGICLVIFVRKDLHHELVNDTKNK